MLIDPEVLAFFRPFLARERTVGAAADEVGCAPSVMLYRVGTFLRAGLLRIVREEPRAGRALKVYRSSFDAYLVPYDRTPFATLEEAFLVTYGDTARRMARAMAGYFRRSGWEGYRLYRAEGGQTWLTGAPDATTGTGALDLGRVGAGPASVGPSSAGPLNAGPVSATDFAIDVYLNAEEAEALTRRLNALLQEYDPYGSTKGREHVRRHLFSVAFAPIAGEG